MCSAGQDRTLSSTAGKAGFGGLRMKGLLGTLEEEVPTSENEDPEQCCDSRDEAGDASGESVDEVPREGEGKELTGVQVNECMVHAHEFVPSDGLEMNEDMICLSHGLGNKDDWWIDTLVRALFLIVLDVDTMYVSSL